jgi:uncharacterized metal-binding protein
MASGQLHTTATLCMGAAGVYHFVDANNIVNALAWGAGALYQTVIQPDLDFIDEGQKTYYGMFIIRETFPRIVEPLFAFYWSKYARLLSHRSFWSHAPIVGTLGRLIYAGWLIVFLWIFRHIPEPLAWMITAIVAGDILHWLLDLRIWRVFGAFEQ